MSSFGYAYVFDYSVGKIYEIELDEQDDTTEIALDRRGLKSDDCYVMYTENKISVEPIKLKNDE